MTKNNLVAALADKTGMTKADSGRALDALVSIISHTLSRGERLTWTGFGTFEVRNRAARMGRDPQRGTPLHIPATKTAAFKAGKGLKDAVK